MYVRSHWRGRLARRLESGRDARATKSRLLAIERNPAEFGKGFDLRAACKTPSGALVELWVDIRRDPRPSMFPYVKATREFEEKSLKRVRVRVFAALVASIIKSGNTDRSLAEMRAVPTDLDLLKSLRIDDRWKKLHTLRKTNIEAFYLWHLAHLEEGVTGA